MTNMTIQENNSIVSFKERSLKLHSLNDATPIANEIDKAAKVSGIVFTGNTVGVDAAKKISESLAKRSEFRRALWSDMFTGRSKEEIPVALKYLCDGIRTAGAKLVELDLSDNALGPNGARGIDDFLRSSSAYSLEVLKFNNTGLGIDGAKMVSSALLDCLKRSRVNGTPLKLRVFVGGRNRLENPGISALASAFEQIGTLEEIVIPQNGIYHVGISALAKALEKNPNMKVLNVSDNTFRRKGAEAMAKALLSMKNLQIAHLSDCLIGNGGCALLADALARSCPNLSELYIDGNNLNAEMGRAVVHAVKKKPMTKLDLNTNCLGRSGIETIRKTARELSLEKALGSFSDDEDTADEESADESEVSPNSSKEESSLESESLSDPANAIESNETLLANAFYQNRDVKSLFALGDRAPHALVRRMQAELYLSQNVVKLLFDIASLTVASSDRGLMNLAQETFDSLFKAVMLSKHRRGFMNCLLANLGLIKNEDDQQPVKDVDSILRLLSNSVRHSWFPRDSKSLLAFVLNQRQHKLSAKTDSLTMLMEGLKL